MLWKPIIRSDIKTNIRGKVRITLLSWFIKGKNIAPAIKGVKLGGWGIILLKRINTEKNNRPLIKFITYITTGGLSCGHDILI